MSAELEPNILTETKSTSKSSRRRSSELELMIADPEQTHRAALYQQQSTTAPSEILSPPTSHAGKQYRGPSRRSKSLSIENNPLLAIENPLFTVYPSVIPVSPLHTTADAHIVLPQSTATITPSWETSLERAINAIVSIKATHVRSFDTESTGAYNATGFVVDAEQGIILTNRHVVSPAPITASVVFANYEEVEVIPIYRDPLHDFGFLKFNPKHVKYQHIVEIPLKPHLARVGMEIRVVGSIFY